MPCVVHDDAATDPDCTHQTLVSVTQQLLQLTEFAFKPHRRDRYTAASLADVNLRRFQKATVKPIKPNLIFNLATVSKFVKNRGEFTKQFLDLNNQMHKHKNSVNTPLQLRECYFLRLTNRALKL